MFDTDFVIYGQHATYAKKLCKDRGKDREDGLNIFRRIVDLIEIAPLVGVITNNFIDHNIEADSDKSTVELATIQREKHKLQYVYKTIMLVTDKVEKSEKERRQAAFNYDLVPDGENENMAFFNGYLRGGIDYLYNRFKEAEKHVADKNQWICDEIKDFAEEMKRYESHDDFAE